MSVTLAILALLLTACSGPNWTTDAPPIPVALVKATDPAVCERAIAIAIASWNDKAGGQLFEYVGRDPEPRDHRINVSCLPETLSGKPGVTRREYERNELTRIVVQVKDRPEFHGEREPVIMTHEFGHAVGLDDDPCAGNVMSGAGAAMAITDEDAQYAADIVSGTPQEPELRDYDKGD